VSEFVLEVAFVSSSGRSQDSRPLGHLTTGNLGHYAATEETRNSAIAELKALGFRLIGPPSQFGVTIAGPRPLVSKVFGEDELRVPPSLSSWIDNVIRPPPARFC